MKLKSFPMVSFFAGFNIFRFWPKTMDYSPWFYNANMPTRLITGASYVVTQDGEEGESALQGGGGGGGGGGGDKEGRSKKKRKFRLELHPQQTFQDTPTDVRGGEGRGGKSSDYPLLRRSIQFSQYTSVSSKPDVV